MANIRPSERALGCSFCGNFDEIIDKNTILSIPNTISRKANVSKAIHALGKRNVSNISISIFFEDKFNKEFALKVNYMLFSKYYKNM